MKLSVVMPVYNEVKTIETIIRRVKDVDIDKEIIIVDDCSTDGTRELLQQVNEDGVRVLFHGKNSGKGTALRTGFKYATGDLVIIQDGDLEYDPQDYIKLIKPIRDGIADAVYGSRFIDHVLHCKRPFYLTHFIGNKFLNFLVSLLYKTRITDMETCYKLIKKDVLDKIELSAKGFEFEPEITSNLLKKGFRIHELPIAYTPRDYQEGKKVTWKDGVVAVYVLLKHRFKRK